ncbi:hypothetical protein BBJ28_00006690 [Nothophytophthora sp. Chile5]|nr:hypothetical protein BBJ28_00006690 [Nothophytophthora sp. Chile5]
MTFLAVLRVLTTVAAILVSISPLPDFWHIHKTRSTGDVSMLPIVLLFCKCYMWSVYAYLVNSILPVFVVNVFGMATSVVFGAIYYRWSSDRPFVHKLLARASAVLVVFTLYQILGGNGVTNQSPEQVEAILGFMSVALNIAMYAAPLENMKKVVRTKNAASLPILMSAAFLGHAVLWVVYSFAANDMFVMVPNALGTALCTAQVALYAMYRPGRAVASVGDKPSVVAKRKVSVEGLRTYWTSFTRLFKNPQGYEELSSAASVAPLPSTTE